MTAFYSSSYCHMSRPISPQIILLLLQSVGQSVRALVIWRLGIYLVFIFWLLTIVDFLLWVIQQPTIYPDLGSPKLVCFTIWIVGLMAVVRSKLLPGTLRDVVLGTRKFSAQMALEGGIVDSVYAYSPQTLEAAVSEAQKLAGRGWKKEIYSELRLGAFPGVLEELDAHRDPYLFPVSSKL